MISYPAVTDRPGAIVAGAYGLHVQIPAIGRHLVIIESPIHNQWIPVADVEFNARILRAFLHQGMLALPLDSTSYNTPIPPLYLICSCPSLMRLGMSK
jgi:hypothetical protein